MKKSITILLLAAILTSHFACASENPSGNDTSDDAGTTAPEESVIDDGSRDAVKSSITGELDFGGATLTILSRDKEVFLNEFSADEENGDTMNDAIYQRNLAVEDRMKIKIDVISRSGDYGAHTQFNSDVVKEVMAGDTPYDVISYYAYAMPMIASEKVLYNLKDLDYINFGKPWWHQKFIENAEVYGKLYAVAGDINLTTVSYRRALFFNKTLAADYLKGVDIYKTVFDGKWTQEYMISLTKDLYEDLDGDGKDSPEDFYGYYANASGDSFPVGAGITYTNKTADGGYEWDFFNERNNDIIERFYSMYKNNPGIYFNDQDDTIDQKRFAEGRCIFFSYMFNYTEKLRDMKQEYGIIPMPKYDESQSQYYSIANDNYSQIAVPLTVKDEKMVGAFLELAGEYSYKKVIPAYYEVAMKGKYLRDDESCRMFDLIIDSAWYDFANINTSAVGDPVFITRQASYHRDGQNFASMWAARKDELTSKLQALLDNYKN